MAQQALNPWLDRGVFHWAHRGGAREAPQNTVYAMTRALEAGAHGIELDVHLTRDGHLVVVHDPKLDRTAAQGARVARSTLEELRRCDPAHWWAPGQVSAYDPTAPADRYVLRGPVPTDPELRIPTLEEVLDAFPGVPLTVEVKVKAAVQPVVELLRRRPDTLDRHLIVTSLKDSIVRRLRRSGPEFPLAPGRVWMAWFLLRSRLRLPPRRSRYVALQVPPRHRSVRVVDERLVRAAHRCGMAVHVWTIDDEQEMRQLIDLGIDGIMTDSPSVLATVIAGGQAGTGSAG